MSSAKEIRTFKDIQDAIIRRGKIEDNTANRDSIKEKINTSYINISYEEPYRWSGETAALLLSAQYNTGTITATNGDATITGSGTSWTSTDHFGWSVKVGSVNYPYKVIRVASTTEIELNAHFTATTASSQSYTLYQDEIGLPPDLQDVRKLRIPGLSQHRQPVPTSPEDIDNLRDQSPFRTGTPRVYTIWGKKHFHQKTWATFSINTDYWEENEDDEPTSKSLIVYPGVRTEERQAIIRYTKTIYPLVLDAEEPLIPVENRQVLVWGVLRDHFLSNRDIQTSREWNRFYLDLKARMAGDIESTDDELILHYDKRQTSRQPRYAEVNEDIYTAS